MRHLYSQRVGELEVIIGRRLDVNYFIEFVNVDAYWKYWVDGNSARFRLRINSQRGTFGRSELVQFVYHELLAHCCQMAAFHKSIQEKQIALFHGCTTVHGPEQFLFEGLAQSLPLFLRNEDALDPLLIARIRLAHFRSLVNHNVHIMINSGSTIEQCVKYVEDWVPFGNRGLIAHGLHSISNNCLFRCYQFVYPLSMDFFVSLAERCVEASASGLLARFYAQPLYYDAIQRLQES
jgi:hypothetical protein